MFDGASRFLLALLSLATLVEVLDDDADEHVEHEEADEQQERDEVQQAPLAVVPLRLRAPHSKLLQYSQRRAASRMSPLPAGR